MEISVSGQSIDESLDAYIRTKIGKLDRFLFELDHAKVHLSEERNPRIADSEKCEITLEGHGNHIRCHVSAPDKRTAIDLVEDCLALSGNRLTCTIPAGLANLARFTTLGICQNHLTGSIPTRLRTGINLISYPTSRGYNPIACQRTSTPTPTKRPTTTAPSTSPTTRPTTTTTTPTTTRPPASRSIPRLLAAGCANGTFVDTAANPRITGANNDQTAKFGTTIALTGYIAENNAC